MEGGITVEKGDILFFLRQGSHFVALAGLKFVILLLQSSECWDYRHESLHLA
jgi:hypothetical protein